MATIFNINDTHVKYVNALLKQKDIVIIHGDGHIFACKKGETISILDDEGNPVTQETAIFGSNHHKKYNAGYDAREAIAKAGFRAIYRKKDTPPETVADIEKAFIEQANIDLEESITAKAEAQSNIFALPKDAEKAVRKSKAPEE